MVKGQLCRFSCTEGEAAYRIYHGLTVRVVQEETLPSDQHKVYTVETLEGERLIAVFDHELTPLPSEEKA